MTKEQFEKFVEENSFVETHNNLEIMFIKEVNNDIHTVWLKKYPG